MVIGAECRNPEYTTIKRESTDRVERERVISGDLGEGKSDIRESGRRRER